MVTSTLTEIIVQFRGEGSGIGPLTWGQQDIWDTMQRTGRTLNIGGVMPVAAGTGLDEITQLLRFVVGRHQALRTRLRLETGTDGTARPRQVVSSSGEIPLCVLDVDAGGDAAHAAEELRRSYEDTPFDHAGEWPVRMAVVRQAGELTHIVVQYCHLAVDGAGIEAIVRDLANMRDETRAVRGGTAARTGGAASLPGRAAPEPEVVALLGKRAARHPRTTVQRLHRPA